MAIPVGTEQGGRRVFACALDWPGWCRSGRTEEQALETLAGYGARYAPVAADAGLSLPGGYLLGSGDFDVVERAPGNATTDFGAPAVTFDADRQPVGAVEAARLARLVMACWAALERVAGQAPAELRKGPRGGGRDRDQVVDHVAAAEVAYARKVGIGKALDLATTRRALVELLATPSGPAPLGGAKGWAHRYAARRIAWHALDHAWEIEDKS
ncbi:MAG: hypothetical protein ACRD0J_09630 [Acidimicrobiales bacterium]